MRSMESPKTTAEMAQVATGAQTRPVWSSQGVYIMATIAGVVGLGNIWRPYMVGQNGGGTFILAYAICILATGFPIMVLESSDWCSHRQVSGYLQASLCSPKEHLESRCEPEPGLLAAFHYPSRFLK